MKKTKFQRLTAFALALLLCVGGCVMTVGASEASSITDTTTADIKALLNATPYNDYRQSAANREVPLATESVTIDAIENLDEGKTTAAVTKDKTYGEEERKGLYVPESGSVSWTTDKIAKEALYNVVVEYYPVANKAASIERIFKINGEVPFAEARYMTISKIWKNPYADGRFELSEGESADSYLKKAGELGITAEKITENGKTYVAYKMPEYFTADVTKLIDDLALRFFTTDIDGNELRASSEQAPAWTTFEFVDANGFYQTPFQFAIKPDPETGLTTITMDSVNEPIVIGAIHLVVPEETMTYNDYKKLYEGKAAGKGTVKIEGENFYAVSSQTIYAVSDSTSAITSPSATDRIVLNAIGGEKWQTPGQWVEYKFRVDASGMYDIAPRFKQSLLDGMYTSRMLFLYSEGLEEGADGYYNGVPFEEAGRLQFNYSSDWQSSVLTDGETKFSFYFKEGVTYTMRLQVSLGNMSDIVRKVQAALDAINADYLNILKLTGTTPDESRDYGFYRIMPNTISDLKVQRDVLGGDDMKGGIIGELKSTGAASSMSATLEKVWRLLDKMYSDEDEIAKNLEQLKTYIGSLGTWLSDAKTQPLMIDFVNVQPKGAELPKDKANFWQAFTYEIKCFFKSFFRNYDRMGAMTEATGEDSVEVWLAYGRDQSQVIRGLINNDFTKNSNVPINLKLVAGGTLLPSILSGSGPDVYIGLGQGDVINYAIRGALLPIDSMLNEDGTVKRDGEGNPIARPDYKETVADFNEAAMLVLGIEDATKEYHCYGLPETQSFSMMFIREDILAELDIDIPKTWDDVKEAIPVLQANNMQIGMHNDSNIFLYQSGGELFADDGMRINLDSNVALDAFTTMCDMFTMYSFPYKYDFANRFRTGEMPIGFAGYTATYNHLKVFATEIEGLWGFYPLPGYADEDGNINNVAVSTITAIVMIKDCENTQGAWEFMKWHAGADCQEDYSNEMVAILGPSAKHPTASKTALASLPWTAEELEQVQLQFNNLAAIPNYPGTYIIARYTQFAFLDAYNDKVEPATALQQYITTINKEITRKRDEFDLETLELGQTLAQKRMEEAEAAIRKAQSSSSYSDSYKSACESTLSLIKGYETEDYASIRTMANTLEELNSTLFKDAVALLRQAANALVSYEAYK